MGIAYRVGPIQRMENTNNYTILEFLNLNLNMKRGFFSSSFADYKFKILYGDASVRANERTSYIS